MVSPWKRQLQTRMRRASLDTKDKLRCHLEMDGHHDSVSFLSHSPTKRQAPWWEGALALNQADLAGISLLYCIVLSKFLNSSVLIIFPLCNDT